MSRYPVVVYQEPRYRQQPRKGTTRFLRPRRRNTSGLLGGVLIAISLFGLFCYWQYKQHEDLPHPVYRDLAASKSAPVRNRPVPTQPPASANFNASKNLVRLNQLDPNQYVNQEQHDIWAYSACSSAVMTEYLNAYGGNYKIHQILTTEANLKEITPELGMLRPEGFDTTFAHYGFQTHWLNNPNVNDMVKLGNNGQPVIINFPPDRWDGGHFLIVRGGNEQSVFLVDSSRLNMQVMSRSTFLKYWTGYALIASPK